MAETERNALEIFIEEEIMKEYAKFGGYSTASVRVTFQKVEIWFNTENPYLGVKFFDFLEELSNAIRKKLIDAGYEPNPETGYLFSFLSWTFQRTGGF